MDPGSVPRLYRALGVAGAACFAGAVALGFMGALFSSGRPPPLSIDPSQHAREFARQGDLARVLAENDAALRLDPGPEQRFDLLVRNGRLLSHLGRREEAILRFRDAQTLAPARVEPRVFLIAELVALGRHAEALPEYREVLARAPGDALLYRSYGDALARTGDTEAALGAYRRALELDPKQVGARVAAADLLLETGRRADALALLRAAQALRPSDPVLLNNLAWLLATDPKPAPGAAVEAVAYASRAVESSPDAGSYDTLGAALASAGRFEEARAAAMRALHLARERGDAASAEAIGARVRGYAKGRRYVEGAVPHTTPPAK